MAANLKFWDGTAWRIIIKISRWNGVSWDEVQRIRRWTDNGDGTRSWQDVYVKGGTSPPPSPPPTPTPTPAPVVALTVSVSPSSEAASIPSAGFCTAGPFTVTATGGVSPYTYIFTINSYTAPDPPTITVDPTSPNVASFTQELTNDDGSGEVETGTFTCTVVDANGSRGSCLLSARWKIPFTNTGTM